MPKEEYEEWLSIDEDIPETATLTDLEIFQSVCEQDQAINVHNFDRDIGVEKTFNECRIMVMQAIIGCKAEIGINLKELFSRLKSLSRQSIQEALHFLAYEGHIYSIIDEFHYKATDNV
ncbi:hypothetical protein AVEN_202224-1 [Araneus ventricosus]|uniref:Replication protein A C-terminal domain-containing protein n=1 Tax=Araneus ventricosus TaxID=182803 RepID=A0A4Y2UPG2_ARAVE|nr:hypothetical protein AVEN_202224-1 [Araneus ventricosus]